MKKILIIEDDALIGKLIEVKVLQKNNFLVFRAFDGQQGIEMIDEHKPDLIILDLAMPKKNGFEVLESLKTYSGIRPYVIVMSNLANREDIEKTAKLGANEHIVKTSITIDAVVEKIYKILE